MRATPCPVDFQYILIGLSLVDTELLNLMHLNRVSYMVRNPQLIFVFLLLGFSAVVPHHAFFQNTYNPEWGPVHQLVLHLSVWIECILLFLLTSVGVHLSQFPYRVVILWPDCSTHRNCVSSFLDIDECAAKMHYCHANTVCVNLPGLYRCDCIPGYIRVDDFSCTGEHEDQRLLC